MTAPDRRRICAGNWKMNGLAADLPALAAIAAGARGARSAVVVALPATLLSRAAPLGLALAGQDCHAAPKGPHTGDISAPMLADAGAGWVILGHSERRRDHGETDAMVAAKAAAARAAGLTAIVCLGETEAEYRAGATLGVLSRQLAASLPAGATASDTVVAYEPVWAIGTGRTPTLAEIAEVHGFLRDRLTGLIGSEAKGTRLLYGGSVKPSNAAEIFAVPHVDGALVGGASLKAADFGAIVAALSA
jgi:triosephosphate isomerase